MIGSTYDSTKHHLGLSAKGDTLYGLMMERGSYRKSPQPRDLRQMRLGESQVFTDQRLSYWLQNDFTGGAYQDVLEDESQFRSCFSMMPSTQSKGLRTCQNLAKAKDASGVELTEGNYPGISAPIDTAEAWGKLHMLVNANGVYYVRTFEAHATVEGRFTTVAINVNRAGTAATAIACNTILGVLVVGYADGLIREYRRSDYALWRILSHMTSAVPSRVLSVKALTVYNDFVIVAEKNRVIYYDAADTSGGTGYSGVSTDVKFEVLGDATEEFITGFETHRNELYILSVTSPSKTAIDFTTLVSGVIPWVGVPYLFQGQSLTSYAGRLYLGGASWDVTGKRYYAELYEITGTQFRRLRTYYPSSQVNPDATMTAIHSSLVAEGNLFFANWQKNCVEMYSFEEDAFFSTFAMPSDAGTVRPHLALTTGIAMMILGVDGSGGGGLYYVPKTRFAQMLYWPRVESSEFAFEPSIDKRFVEVQATTRYTVPWLRYSVNGSPTWTYMSPTEVTQAADGYTFVSRFVLPTSAVGRTFRWRIDMNPLDPYDDMFGATDYYWRELVQVAVGYLPLPNTLFQFDFAVTLAETILQLDQTEATTNPVLDLQTLWAFYEQGTLLDFRERGDATRTVQIQNMHEIEAVASDPPRECVVSLHLVEVPGYAPAA